MVTIQGLQFHVVLKNKAHPKFGRTHLLEQRRYLHQWHHQNILLQFNWAVSIMLSRPMPEKLGLCNCSKIVKHSILLTLNENECQSQIDRWGYATFNKICRCVSSGSFTYVSLISTYLISRSKRFRHTYEPVCNRLSGQVRLLDIFLHCFILRPSSLFRENNRLNFAKNERHHFGEGKVWCKELNEYCLLLRSVVKKC